MIQYDLLMDIHYHQKNKLDYHLSMNIYHYHLFSFTRSFYCQVARPTTANTAASGHLSLCEAIYKNVNAQTQGIRCHQN